MRAAGEESGINITPQTIERGFTAVELLVVITAIAFVRGILMPAALAAGLAADCIASCERHFSFRAAITTHLFLTEGCDIAVFAG